MRLPKDILSGNYKKPRLFLCEPDKTKICQLETTNTHGSFKFNAYSELSFEVARTYNDIITGAQKINPFYNKIEAFRLIELENIGYFEIQGPDLSSDGIKEAKTISCYSLEYTLAQKYLENFHINTGELESLEVVNNTAPIVLYSTNKKRSLLDLVLSKVYGWTIGHVDYSLKNLSRQFSVDRESVYDFLMNEVCEKFNCYIEFDTIKSEINIYAQSLTAKFYGDGETKTFVISPPFDKINTVAIGGYKTTKWNYESSSGKLTLEEVPADGTYIEVIDGALTKWETDVFVSFENLSQQMNVNYNADDIKTVLTVTYGDDEDIRDANLGLPYITDISYYCSPEWMGQDLYDAYVKYLQKYNSSKLTYESNAKTMLELNNKISFEENRLSLGYSQASVDENTQGTYYIRGGTSPNYYYTEVSLPSGYNENTIYYSINTANLTEEKVEHLYSALKIYFNANDEKHSNWQQEFNAIKSEFSFMTTNTIDKLITNLQNATTEDAKTTAVNNFLNEMWNEIGRTPLKTIYYEKYKIVQVTNVEAGWSQKTNDNYWYYYPVVVFLNSINAEIQERTTTINDYQTQYDNTQKANIEISNSLLMSANFTEGQLIRLNAFLREDELHIDDIVETVQDSIADSFKIKQDAMEAGRIELQKRSQPQLQFSMTMANIYALPEFEPIVEQFQLGNVIKVGLRPDYIKQSRLLQVDISFEDFSDFSCEFGELTSLRTQSDIHADLLSQAISAGKSVATNSSYWTKGSDQASSIDKRLEEGLLNSIEALKNLDATQHAYIDKYGIHLETKDNDGNIGDERVWMVNNQIVFTDDAFKTSKAALGKFKIGDVEYYGLIADAVIAGYIEGSTIVGGTIDIGNGNFVVDQNGTVTMNSGTIEGYATKQELNNISTSTPIISDTQPKKANNGQIWINTSTNPNVLMIYENGYWKYFSQQTGGVVYTSLSEPTDFKIGDIWVKTDGSIYIAEEQDGNIVWVNSSPEKTQWYLDAEQTFTFNKDDSTGELSGLTIGQSDQRFKVNITSKGMVFYDGNTEVVYIKNNAANIDNLIVENNFLVNAPSQFSGNVVMSKVVNNKTCKFEWQIEDTNGSYSLILGS